nr:ribosomal RNA processing protein 1 homolog [Leptinotarsa decemlineata]
MAVLNASRETDHEKMNIVNDGDKKVHLIAQELKLAKILAGNDLKAREKALKSLGKWFENRSKTMPFTNEDLQRIWKGLFYCMWMSDKPLVQEDCANKIAKLVHMPTLDASLLFFRAGMTILANEWFGIDQLRMDKFLMLVRRLLRETLITLRNHKLNSENIKKFNEVLSDTILSPDAIPPLGLFMHYVEIFLEELAKVTQGKIQPDNTVQLLQPFIKIMVCSDDGRKKGHIRKFIFTYLIRQSNLGLEYQAKYNAWKQQGFPGSIDSMQKIKLGKDEKMLSDEEEISSHEKPLDPRAGRVDVEIPQIKFSAKGVAAALLEYRFHRKSSPKSRKIVTSLAEQFTKLANGVYPLGVKKVKTIEETDLNLNIRKAANNLIKFEQKLLGKNKKRKIEKVDEQAQIETKRMKITEKVSENTLETSENRKKTNCKERELEIIGESTKERKIGSKKVNNKLHRSDGERNACFNISDNRKKKSKSCRSLKKSEKETQNLENIECIFERNSGVWVVHVGEDKNKEAAASLQSDFPSSSAEVLEGPSISSGSTISFSISSELPELKTSPAKRNTHENKPETYSTKTSANSSINSISPSAECDSPKSGLSPVKLFESPPKEKELFPKSEWDEPLLEGEYEICISSKKHIAKMKKLGNKPNQSLCEVTNSAMQKIKGKSRLSLDPSVVKNPFSTPMTTKRVKINTRLNRSQDVHEHHAQILSSPAIPYDAHKKPSKPLLKRSATSTPINPFHKKQLSI